MEKFFASASPSSLLREAFRHAPQVKELGDFEIGCEPPRTRTENRLIKSQLLTRPGHAARRLEARRRQARFTSALELMVANGVHQLPIVRDGALVGMLSRSDVMSRSAPEPS